MAEQEVSAGTANRAVALLKTWGLIDTRRGRRATILNPPDAVLLDAEPTEATESRSTPEPASVTTEAVTLDLRLVHLGVEVRALSAVADPADSAKLTALLTNAARRHGGRTADLAEYELEVHDVDHNLLTTFVVS